MTASNCVATTPPIAARMAVEAAADADVERLGRLTVELNVDLRREVERRTRDVGRALRVPRIDATCGGVLRGVAVQARHDVVDGLGVAATRARGRDDATSVAPGASGRSLFLRYSTQ